MSRKSPNHTAGSDRTRDAFRQQFPGELTEAAARLAREIPSMDIVDLLRVGNAVEGLLSLASDCDNDTGRDPSPRWPVIGSPTAAALNLPDGSAQENPGDRDIEQCAGLPGQSRAPATIRAQ